MDSLQGEPSGEALQRLIGQVRRMPSPGKGSPASHFFEAKERFILLRRLGVESVYLAHQERPVDFTLLLEIGALTTNRLIALVKSLPASGMTRQSFFKSMEAQLESQRAIGEVRTSGMRALVVAQSKIDSLEQRVLLATEESETGAVRRCAVGCAVSIASFLEAWWCRPEQGQDV